jgi:mannosyltransferase OCH1-like enzyme
MHLANQNRFIRSNFPPKSPKFRKLRRQVDTPLDSQNHTLLYYAISESEFKLAELLIQRGSDVNLICDDIIKLSLEREYKGDFQIFEFIKERIIKELNNRLYCVDNPWFKIVFKRNFAFLNPKTKIEEDVPLIPKIIHQIWLGPRPVPEQVKWMMASWQRINPSWVYKLWTNDDIENFPFFNKKAFDSAINWGMKSDILRCEVLNRFGGVYVDVDFECIKPLDSLHYLYDFYCCVNPSCNESLVQNAVIAAKAGHPIIRSCLEKWQLIHSFSTNDVGDVMSLTGPWFLTDRVAEYLTSSKENQTAVVLPEYYFFPFPYQDRLKYWEKTCTREEIVKKYCSPESLGIHYWAMSWSNSTAI